MADPNHFAVEYNPRNQVFSYVNNKGHRVQFGAGPVTPPPTDGNVYPLHMPTGGQPGAPVTIGTGTDQIQIKISGNPTSAPDGPPVFNVIIDGVLVATELTVTDFSGQDQGQVFTIKGGWGPGPHTITLSPSLTKPGLVAAWQTAVQYDSLPCYYNGPKPDARNNSPMVNATNIWNNLGWSIAYTTTKAAETPPVPVPTVSVITGASIDGKPTDPGTLAGLIERTPAGAILQLPPGRIIGTSAIGAITLAGAGKGKTIIDCTGLPVAFGKGVLVPTVSGAMIQDMTITGASGPDKNAAAVRQQGDGIDFTLARVEVFGCQDGVLTFPANVSIIDCDFHNNGAGDGFSHEIYLSGVTGSVATLTGTVSVCGKGATHAAKFRTGTTNIDQCSLTGSTDGTGSVGGSVLDLPDGGNATITDTAIIMGAGAAQRELISHALESTKVGAGGTVKLQGVKVSISGEAGYIHTGDPTATLIIGDGCTYVGDVAPTMVGWGAVQGAFTKAA